MIEKIINDKTVENGSTSFTFSSSYNGTFSLKDHWVHNSDNYLPALQPDVTGSEYTVQENALAGWRVADIHCETTFGNLSSYVIHNHNDDALNEENAEWDAGDDMVTITLFPNEVVECQFFNEEHFCGDGTQDEGEACDDGNNEDGDGCSATCEIDCVDAALDCSEADECQEAICVPTTGGGAVCGTANLPNNTECSDEEPRNKCTLDICVEGQCTHPADESIVCSALDDCHVPGECVPATGECSNPPGNEGDACDDTNDQNACTNEVCRAGQCVSEDNGKVCDELIECHGPGYCDASTGDCAYDPLPDGTSCADDQNACTTDICVAGQCEHDQLLQCCGNGELEGTEICDDGNLDNGDGCDANCNFEGAIKIRKEFEGEHDPFEFDPSWLDEDGNFLLGNGDVWFSHFLTAGVPYTVAELPVSGWDADAITCECFESDIQGEAISSIECTSDPVVNLDDNKVTITLAGAELVICTFHNVEVPEECGDGVLQEGEACDPGIAEGDEGYVAGCREDCTFCGDGVINNGEECDDGPLNGVDDGDGHCHEDCTICPPTEPFCGDGSLTAPETCDPAIESGLGHADNCRTEGDAACTFCGDRVKNGDEACDGGEDCDANCQVIPPPGCGDNQVNQEGETCDGTDTPEGVVCRENCTYCGDENIDEGFEQCEVGDDHCGSDCQFEAFCGDGVVNGDEECEVGDAHCEACYLVPYCGDGNPDDGEECDLGELNGTDGALCDADCRTIEEEVTGCTRTIGYWKTHEELWTDVTLVLGDESYNQTELLAILNTSVGGDASLNLAHQLIGALLNQEVNNASTPDEVDTAIATANDLLDNYDGKLPYGVVSGDADYAAMIAAKDILDAYNNGNAEGGPSHCVDSLSSSSSSKKKSSSATTTSTVTTQSSNSASSNTNANAGLASTNIGTSAGGGCSSTGSGMAGHMPTMALLMLSLVAMRLRRSIRVKARK